MRQGTDTQVTESAWDWLQAALLAAAVFLSRYLTRAALYYVDGPILVKCIRDGTFVIQPPGYWLFAHLGGLFRDPEFGLQFSNQVFSAVGVAVFFLLCRELKLARGIAWAASLAYASVFFVWFAGDVHSSYASQILFAPLTVYCFLRYRRQPSMISLLACGASYAIGAGLRPSDGAFLGPLFLYLTFKHVGRPSQRVLLLAVTAVLCLTWYVPNQIAMRAAQSVSFGFQVSFAREASPIFAGITAHSIANTLRVVLPLLAAFWMLIPTLFFKRSGDDNRMLLLWVLPGLVFVLLIFMADPVYFCYLTGAVILAAALSENTRAACFLLIACAIFNTAFFLFAVPLRSEGRAAQAVNFYVVKYSYYGVRHRWMSIIRTGGQVP